MGSRGQSGDGAPTSRPSAGKCVLVSLVVGAAFFGSAPHAGATTIYDPVAEGVESGIPGGGGSPNTGPGFSPSINILLPPCSSMGGGLNIGNVNLNVSSQQVYGAPPGVSPSYTCGSLVWYFNR